VFKGKMIIVFSLFLGAATVGSISVTASATAYNTSSDQRLKENIADADDAGSKIDAIKYVSLIGKLTAHIKTTAWLLRSLMTVAPEAVTKGPRLKK
jgi:hypothetical protein